MTPDPVGIMKQKLIDPQQWNMYAYARNNPLRFVDTITENQQGQVTGFSGTGENGNLKRRSIRAVS